MSVLAVDVGGTTIKLGLVEQGKVLAHDRLPAHADAPMAERLEAIASAAERLLSSSALPPSDCQGIGLALPFLVDPARARVFGEFGKFPGATEIDYAHWARERLNLPTALENDLRVALLGEWQFGAASGATDAVMIALGTGLGCAAICGGQLLRGHHHRAATLLGHSSIAFNGEPGRCGNFGCAEDLASTATLPALARRQSTFKQSALSQAGTIDYERVFALAANGDACSRQLLEQSLRVWSTVALNAVLAYDPAILVLGGGVLVHQAEIVRGIQQHIAGHTPGLRWEIPVVPSALGPDAALLGCEVLFTDQHPPGGG